MLAAYAARTLGPPQAPGAYTGGANVIAVLILLAVLGVFTLYLGGG